MDEHDEGGELLKRAHDARLEANKACVLDEARNYYEAIQHYDQTITLIDDILETISATGAVWERLVVFRQTYSDRMVSCNQYL